MKLNQKQLAITTSPKKTVVPSLMSVVIIMTIQLDYFVHSNINEKLYGIQEKKLLA
jgi:hypothetical protein